MKPTLFLFITFLNLFAISKANTTVNKNDFYSSNTHYCVGVVTPNLFCDEIEEENFDFEHKEPQPYFSAIKHFNTYLITSHFSTASKQKNKHAKSFLYQICVLRI